MTRFRENSDVGSFNLLGVNCMATYLWNNLYDGQSITVDLAAGDILDFSAAEDLENEDVDLTWVFFDTDEKYVIANNLDFYSITSTNLLWPDFTLFVGDNTVGTTNDDLANNLTGTSGNDIFFGLGGDDTLSGGDGNDSFIIWSLSGSDSMIGGNGVADLLEVDDGEFGVVADLTAGTVRFANEAAAGAEQGQDGHAHVVKQACRPARAC